MYASCVWTKSLGLEFMLLTYWLRLCTSKFLILTWETVDTAWIPPETQMWNASQISDLFVTVVWCWLFFDFDFSSFPVHSCHWLRLHICSVWPWTATPQILLFCFLSAPSISHLRSWADQCMLPFAHRWVMQHTLGYKRQTAFNYWLWQIRWVVFPLGTIID